MYLVLWRDNSYFLKPTPKNCSETDVIKMLEFLIDNIPAAQHISGHLWHRYTMNSAQPLGTLDSVASMLVATFYQGHHDKNQKHIICKCCWNALVVITIRSFPHLWLFTWLVTRVTCQVSLLTLQEHLNSPMVFRWQGTCICILNWTLCRALIRFHTNHYDDTFLPRQICIIKKSI
jgi:hypothetical protein